MTEKKPMEGWVAVGLRFAKGKPTRTISGEIPAGEPKVEYSVSRSETVVPRGKKRPVTVRVPVMSGVVEAVEWRALSIAFSSQGCEVREEDRGF